MNTITGTQKFKSKKEPRKDEVLKSMGLTSKDLKVKKTK